MFGMKFGGEKKPVAKVETNESLEGQIEQETIKLDANLESLKAEIDAIGGVEELNKKLEYYNNTDGFISSTIGGATMMIGDPKEMIKYSAQAGALIAGASTAIIYLSAFVGAIAGIDSLQINLDELATFYKIIGGTTLATPIAAGGLGMTLGFLDKTKDWWENRKLKSLKNEAELAGIA